MSKNTQQRYAFDKKAGPVAFEHREDRLYQLPTDRKCSEEEADIKNSSYHRRVALHDLSSFLNALGKAHRVVGWIDLPEVGSVYTNAMCDVFWRMGSLPVKWAVCDLQFDSVEVPGYEVFVSNSRFAVIKHEEEEAFEESEAPLQRRGFGLSHSGLQDDEWVSPF